MSEEVICNITPPSSPTVAVSNTYQDGGDDLEACFSSKWFICLGEAKLDRVILHENSYIQSKEIHIFEDIKVNSERNKSYRTITLFNNSYDLASMFLYEADAIFRGMRSEILYLHDAAKSRHTDLHTLSDFHSTQNHLRARQNCVSVFTALRRYIRSLHIPQYAWIVNDTLPKIEDKLNGFRLFLPRLSDLPEYVLHHAAQPRGDKCTEASYHLFHCTLDMSWLHLTSVYLVDDCRKSSVGDDQLSQPSSTTSSSGRLDIAVVALMADLVQLALHRFEKVQTEDRNLLIKSPFTCSCVAELWTLLVAMTNKLSSKGASETFWMGFNKVMEEFLTPSNRSRKPNCRTVLQIVTRNSSNPYGFSLWLLKNIAMVNCQEQSTTNGQVSQANYKLLETILKGLLSSNIGEARMRVCLTLLEKILIKYWEPDAKPIILLWEYFQKRLKSTFFVPGSSIDSIAVMSQSAAGMVRQVKARLNNTSAKHLQENSYNMFLRILGCYLQRVSASGQSQHWNQIRGRIYSKLSATKVNGLDETGLYHLVALFLTLAVTADLGEVSKKLQSLLVSYSETSTDADVSRARLVWRSYLALCVLLAERGEDVTPALSHVIARLGLQRCDVSLYRTFLDGLKDLLDTSARLRVDYTSLVGGWMPRYLAECSPNDTSRLLDTLELLMLQVQNDPMDHDKFQGSVWQHLGPYLRQRVAEDNPPLQLAELCLCLCLPNWSVGREVLHLVLLNHSTHMSLVQRFLSKLVQHNELLAMLRAAPPASPEAHDILILKSWVRCSLLSLEYTGSELSRVTNYVAHLPFISEIAMDLPSATDPLVHFIVNVHNKFQALQDICKKCEMRQVMSRVLTGLDSWVEPHVRQNKSPALLGRIYHVVGLVFQQMPTFIYSKGRVDSVLKKVLDILLLPQTAFKNNYDPPHKAVIAAEIHLYINGLMDLYNQNDGYIGRCIEDMLKVYIPLVLNYGQCKLHECIQRVNDSVKLILNTVCLFMKRKTSNQHAHCAQALKFLKSVVRLYSHNQAVLLVVVDQCFEHICDVIMFCDDFHPAKTLAREVMVAVYESPIYGEQLSAHIQERYDSLCRDYLSFLPKKLFSLFQHVINHRPELIVSYLPKLYQHVRTVEQKRGITFDLSLRNYMKELESALISIRKGP